MKSIRVTLSPPKTEKCTKCNYTANYARRSRRSKCPKCGESVTLFSHNKGFSTVRTSIGRYNLCSTDKQIQYCFDLGTPLKDELSLGYVIDLDNEFSFDIEDPIPAARELLSIYENYIYTSSLPDIKRLLAHLLEVEDQENQNRLNYNIKRLKDELFWAYYDKD